MYFADTLLRTHSAHTEPNELFEQDVKVAALDILAENDINQIQNETATDKILTQIIRVHTIGMARKQITHKC